MPTSAHAHRRHVAPADPSHGSVVDDAVELGDRIGDLGASIGKLASRAAATLAPTGSTRLTDVPKEVDFGAHMGEETVVREVGLPWNLSTIVGHVRIQVSGQSFRLAGDSPPLPS